MKEIPEKVFGKPFEGASISLENNPALLGVGYIIGPRISALMMGGGVLSYLVLIPAIKYFGSAGTLPLAPETASHDRRHVGRANSEGLHSLHRRGRRRGRRHHQSLSLAAADLAWIERRTGRPAQARAAPAQDVPRTDQDLSMKWVLGGIIALLVAHHDRAATESALQLVRRASHRRVRFLFVTVSSRLTGEVGSSSCPTSGMTVATLLLTCLVFLVVGWTAPPYFVTALSIGGIVCIASSNGGTTSQDLKTGFLVGSTPKSQQIAILIGTLASCLVLGPILMKLNQSGTVYVPVAGNKDFAFASSFHANPADYLKESQAASRNASACPARKPAPITNEYFVYHKTTHRQRTGRSLPRERRRRSPVYLADPGINGVYDKRPDGSSVQKFTAPKATLVSYIIKGILGGQLPWGLVLLGVFIAIVLELSGVSVARLCRRRLSSDLHLRAGLRRRHGALAGRQIHATQTRRRELHRRSARCGRRQEQRRPLVLRLHRGRHTGRRAFRLLGHSVEGRLDAFEKWATAHNPFFEGPHADLLAMIPFAALCVLLYLVGRDVLFTPKAKRTS